MTPDKTHSDALAPCPFCGAPAHGYAIEPHSHSPAVLRLVPELPDHPGSYVIEGQCACGSGLIGANEAEVVARWNTRWGSPVVAGDPVAWLSTDHIGERYLCFTKPKDTDPARPLVFGDTTPQPTQAQAGAVPLTDEMASKAGRALSDLYAAECGVDKEDNWKVYGSDFIATAKLVLEAVGIKGGQHGAE